MPRHPDPLRKPQLIAEILEYLLDKPLASLSFRTVATALGVSTYTLVYHFGSRAELIQDIVSAISSRATVISDRLEEYPGTIDVYVGNLVDSWEWTLDPRNRQLQRLEFEAGMLEAIDSDRHTFTRQLHERWFSIGTAALRSFGLSEADASGETRVWVNTFFGLQHDYVVNNDAEAATAAFYRAMLAHRERVHALAAAVR
jgi:AcrR family transcriptional regulator